MSDTKTIYVYEYGWLTAGSRYNNVLFTNNYKDLLAKYLTANPKCGYFTVYYDRIQFSNYVGILKIGDLCVEVLPKTDKHNLNESVWQQLLLEMLSISLRVKAQTTTLADINIKQYNILEFYLHLFMQEVEILLHQGLVKKYRTNISNQTALKGKLLVHHNLNKNLVHAERFYVSHQVYDRDNVYNSILAECLQAIQSISSSIGTVKVAGKLLIDFPECKKVNVSEAMFKHLQYDRKTERYKTAIELARIILLNYHPDLKGGNNNILAIMFDMNLLWEDYIYTMLATSSSNNGAQYLIEEQKTEKYWQHPSRSTLHLNPDILVTKITIDKSTKLTIKETVVLDTKWKYLADTEINDVRQLYAYGHYFGADRRYLLYPGNKDVEVKEGYFYDKGIEEFSKTEKCGLLYVNPLSDNNKLKKKLGKDIIEKLFN